MAFIKRTISFFILIFFIFGQLVAQDTLLISDGGIQETCSAVLFDSGGESGSYGNGENHTITFYSGSPDKQLLAHFKTFGLENGYDYLAVYDGSSTSDELLGNYTGGLIPPDLQSSGSYLTVVFDSDALVDSIGFEMQLSCTDVGYEVYHIDDINGQTVETCNAKFYDSGGKNGAYQDGENYTTTFKAPAGYQLRLTFSEEFNVETNGSSGPGNTPYDVMYIYDASSTASGYISQYDGDDNPGIIYSTSGYLTVRFTSDGAATDEGWDAEITCVPEYSMQVDTHTTVTMCDGYIYDSGGASGNYSNNENDTLTITSGSTNRLYLDFLEFDLEYDASCAADSLAVFDGSSTSASHLGTFCGSSLPTSILSSSNSLTFVFHSDGGMTGDGWKASVSCIPQDIGEKVYTICETRLDTVDKAYFYDCGGPFENYANNQQDTITFCADSSNEVITIDFFAFDVEHATYSADYLSMYDGNSTAAGDRIMSITDVGTGSFTSTEQCMTFIFHSNGSINRSGWEAEISSGIPLSNDAPENSTELTLGESCNSQTFSNFRANGSSVQDPSCGGGNPPPYFGDDMWYYVIVPESEEIIIQTESVTIKDAGMTVYTAANSTLLNQSTEIRCVQQRGEMPSVEFYGDDTTLYEPGDTLWIRFWGWNGHSGAYNICAFEPPAKDPCGARELSVSSECNKQEFTNAYADTYSGITDCAFDAANDKDVWFYFEVPESGKIMIEKNNLGARFTKMALFEGTDCNNLTLTQCAPQTYSDTLIYDTGTPGDTLYLRVWSHDYYKGSFELCVYDPFPENDLLCDAVEVTVNASCQGQSWDYEYATDSQTSGNTAPDPSCSWQSGDKDLWFYTLVPQYKRMIFKATSLQDIGMAIYAGDDCTGLIAENTFLCNGPSDTVVIEIPAASGNFSDGTYAPGDTLWIRVWGDASAYNSSFDRTFDLCVYQPAADDACDALELEVAEVGSCSYEYFSNEEASESVAPSASGLGCGWSSGDKQDVWFKLQVPNSGQVHIDLAEGNTGTIMDNSGMAVYEGSDCNSLSLIACDDTSSDNGNMSKIELSGRTTGEYLWIRVWANSGSNSGTFGICAENPCATVDFAGLSDHYCETTSPTEITLYGSISPEPVGNKGSFTATAGLDITSFSDGTAVIQLDQSDPGDYAVTYTYTSSAGCVSEETKQTSIHPIPTAVLSVDADKDSLCDGQATVLNLDLTGDGDWTVVIEDNHGNNYTDLYTSTPSNPTMNAPWIDDGTGETEYNYSIQSVTDPYGCSSSGSGTPQIVVFRSPITGSLFYVPNDFD